MQQLICITWWVCRCTAIFAEAAVSAASDATWDKSAVFGLPVGFNKSWNHEEGVHIQNLLQGYEVRADWWTSVGSATLAVRFGPAMPPTPLVKRCDLYCGTSLSRLVLQCHLQHAVFLVNILCRDVLLFWQKVNEKWWNYYRWQQQFVTTLRRFPQLTFKSLPCNNYSFNLNKREKVTISQPTWWGGAHKVQPALKGPNNWMCDL